LDITSLLPGSHKLTVRVQDDYWNIIEKSINIAIEPNSIHLYFTSRKGKRSIKRYCVPSAQNANLPRLPKSSKLAVILLGDDWRWGWMFNKCAIKETKRYEARGYKVVVLTSGSFGKSPDENAVAKLIVHSMYNNNLRGFTYIGHGDGGDDNLPSYKRTRGALSIGCGIRSNNLYMTSGQLAQALVDYLRIHRKTCSRQLEYMRLFSCYSGHVQWDIGAESLGLPNQFTFYDAFWLNPPSYPFIRNLIRAPWKVWMSPTAVVGFPCDSTGLDVIRK
jgi:hypothetical protein